MSNNHYSTYDVTFILHFPRSLYIREMKNRPKIGQRAKKSKKRGIPTAVQQLVESFLKISGWLLGGKANKDRSRRKQRRETGKSLQASVTAPLVKYLRSCV